jgi:hypothetical protein
MGCARVLGLPTKIPANVLESGARQMNIVVVLHEKPGPTARPIYGI